MSCLGHVIKFERIRQNIKQVQLSDGICTPSYLSKIESNSIVPSNELIEELIKKLNIIPRNFHSSLIEDEFLKKHKSIYLEALKYKDKEKIGKYLEQNKQCLFSNPTNFYTYHLLLIRLKNMVKNNNSDTSTDLVALSSFSKDFNTYQMFLYHSCLGFNNYYNGNYKLAVYEFDEARKIVELIDIDECETADLFYSLAITNLQFQKLIISLENATKANRFFQKNFLHFRAIESYIIIAVAYKRSMNYEEYYQNLLLAQKIAIQSNITANLSIILLNIASYYSLKFDYEKSITYYEESLNTTGPVWLKLTSIYCIVLQNSMMKNTSKILEWCDKGIELYSSNPEEQNKEIWYHLKIHLAIHKDINDFEKLVTDAISYFANAEDFRHAHKYALLLGNHFNKKGKYKSATLFFMQANKYLALKEKRLFLEDL